VWRGVKVVVVGNLLPCAGKSGGDPLDGKCSEICDLLPLIDWLVVVLETYHAMFLQLSDERSEGRV